VSAPTLTERAPTRRGDGKRWVHSALIIGAGFSGLGTAIKLTGAGVEDLVILERSDRVGGTWRDNTYPGAACDIPSLLYSFSFARNPRWSRAYSPSTEIRGHIEDLVERFDLRRFIHFGTTVVGLEFDQQAGVWTVATNGQSYQARTVVIASGPLSDSSFPNIRGIDDYTGHKILSSRWDHDYDMHGRHIAVIGTGASAVQIIPELVKTAASVKVFQRTAGWVMPRLDLPTPGPAQALFEKLPSVQDVARTALFLGHEVAATGLVWNTPVTTLIQRIATAHLRMQVKDPWLRRQLTPDFRAGCKRMLMSSDYYPALQRPNCKLITWPIARISRDGIRTGDAVEHRLDCIVFATGYDVHLDGPPYPIIGLDGRSLADEWAGHAEAYKSASVSGYPNLFFTTGPNSGPGHNSLLVYVEGQIDYAVRGVTTVLERNLRYLDVRPEVQRSYNASLQRRLRRTTWMSGCSSWYLAADGHNASMYPGFATQYRRQMGDFRLRDYQLVGGTERAEDDRRRRVVAG
jgi:cation diffusion facilitator CzcD-associated flavoprotein CzcO